MSWMEADPLVGQANTFGTDHLAHEDSPLPTEPRVPGIELSPSCQECLSIAVRNVPRFGSGEAAPTIHCVGQAGSPRPSPTPLRRSAAPTAPPIRVRFRPRSLRYQRGAFTLLRACCLRDCLAIRSLLALDLHLQKPPEGGCFGHQPRGSAQGSSRRVILSSSTVPRSSPTAVSSRPLDPERAVRLLIPGSRRKPEGPSSCSPYRCELPCSDFESLRSGLAGPV